MLTKERQKIKKHSRRQKKKTGRDIGRKKAEERDREMKKKQKETKEWFF